MKNHLITLLLLSGILFCCKKDDPEKIGPCGVKDPVNELPWLKEKIQELTKHPSYQINSEVAIFSTQYQGERVFWLWSISTAGDRSYNTCSGEQKFIPVPTPQNEEAQGLLNLMNTPSLACLNLIWSGDDFKKKYCKG